VNPNSLNILSKTDIGLMEVMVQEKIGLVFYWWN